MRSKRKPSLPSRVEEILTRLRQNNPDPRCELYYETPYQLLVSVVLSAQATDKSVNAVMKPLHEAGFDIATALRLGEQGFLAKIKSIGLAPTKAKNVINLSRILRDQFASKVPHSREALENLPGVGRKTANVVLGEIFREPTLAVDTHVFRVTSRLGLQKETTPAKAEFKLLEIIDKKWLPAAHHWFILHGRYHCTARQPQCDTCCLSDICPSKI